ncbi:amidinotransferase [Candidatus Moduliflexus flocculans]|uniref:Amidinotransferase n=1 Tax=Candidatus Moduliflexus flocculans TaxID=1499966 RepID=A0A0S6VTK2_9BACT|nr:amidinotransferase [Candidatus Moduliflexus flocculans]
MIVLEPKRALVRDIGDKYKSCLSTHPLHHTLDLSLAREQHAAYCGALRELGLEIIKVPRDDEHPDSVFVEDNAVVHNGKALICRMAKTSRRGEEMGVEAVLKQYVKVKRATSPATVEGGDVVHLDDKLISGISQRTNPEGIAQMQEWLEVPVSTVFDPNIMHLKSYVTYLGKGIMIATDRYATHPALEGYQIIIPPSKDEYAADTLAVGDTVLMAQGYPEAHTMVKEAGFDVVVLNVSEIQKCDGALTCMSILF